MHGYYVRDNHPILRPNAMNCCQEDLKDWLVSTEIFCERERRASFG